ncbi:MAG TPA: DUF2752 domain-containing protein [Pirellulales bacterium]|nr:DUF2752 domain-containing protein [Pirellulales bacterium]
MTQLPPQGSRQLSPRLRMSLAVAGLSLLAPLAVAGCLRPSPLGFGTHQQLGLPPCTFVWLFGIRCPSCGMTTSWSHAVRGQWLASVRSNGGGAALAATAMIVGPWLVASAVAGRWLLRPPSDRAVAAVATGFIIITLIDWIYRLFTSV